MNYYMYRVNGGEVVSSSTDELISPDAYWGVIESETNYDLSLQYWSDGNTIRLATVPEKNNFAVAAAEDEEAQQKTAAAAFFDQAGTSSEIRAILAIFELYADEINKLRAEVSLPQYSPTQIKNAVKSAINNA